MWSRCGGKGRALAAALAIAAWAGMSMASELQTLTVGEMELSYDAARWRVDSTREGDITMRPIGVIARQFDPVHVSRAPDSGDGGCLKLARERLSESMYEEPTSIHVPVAGLKAMRLTAHARCRNAMPQGVVVCVRHGDSAYLLSASRPGCRSGSNNLFSGLDPVGELSGGLRFTR